MPERLEGRGVRRGNLQHFANWLDRFVQCLGFAFEVIDAGSLHTSDTDAHSFFSLVPANPVVDNFRYAADLWCNELNGGQSG